MKRWLCSLLLLSAVSARAADASEPPADKSKPADRDIEALVLARAEQLACVTPEAHPLPRGFAVRCAGPTREERVRDAPHGWHYIRVFVTPGSKQLLLDGKADYPAGTVVVKEKSQHQGANLAPELYTVMLKREPGYNPELGDWEFFVLDAKAHVTARGKIESCAECHQKFQRAGYLSREYLSEGPGIR